MPLYTLTLTLSHTLTITCTCTCCYDVICGAQDGKMMCSHADFLTLSLSRFLLSLGLFVSRSVYGCPSLALLLLPVRGTVSCEGCQPLRWCASVGHIKLADFGLSYRMEGSATSGTRSRAKSLVGNAVFKLAE